jgi:hypothetical protein
MKANPVLDRIGRFHAVSLLILWKVVCAVRAKEFSIHPERTRVGNTGWKMSQNRSLAEGNERHSAGEGVLSEFDFDDREEVVRVGEQLIDEYYQIADMYPYAADAQDEAAGDIDVFFETAGLDADSDRAVRERIRWVNDALQAWVEFVTHTNLSTHNDVQETLDRIAVDSVREFSE